MTRVTAQRYAAVFKALTEPEALMLLNYLREKGGERSLGELAKAVKISESRARSFLDRLESVYLVNESTEKGQITYFYESTTVADRFRYILERME